MLPAPPKRGSKSRTEGLSRFPLSPAFCFSSCPFPLKAAFYQQRSWGAPRKPWQTDGQTDGRSSLSAAAGGRPRTANGPAPARRGGRWRWGPGGAGPRRPDTRSCSLSLFVPAPRPSLVPFCLPRLQTRSTGTLPSRSLARNGPGGARSQSSTGAAAPHGCRSRPRCGAEPAAASGSPGRGLPASPGPLAR